MGRSTQTFQKKEKEQKRLQAKKEKAEKMQERKAHSQKSKDLHDMMAYIDENGNLSNRPPDPMKRQSVKAEDIEIGVLPQGNGEKNEKIRKGIVINFNEQKGFGFIRDIKTNESLFVHASSLSEPVKGNAKVSFEIEKGPKGRIAVAVTKRV